MKQTTEYQLVKEIMEYWSKCILKKNDKYADIDINDLLETFVIDCKVSYDPADLNRTVSNLTNAQKRKLYRKMLDSGILNR